MVTVVKTEVEGQCQGSVFAFHGLTLKSEGGKLLAKGVKFVLVVGAFQNHTFLWHKITKSGANIA